MKDMLDVSRALRTVCLLLLLVGCGSEPDPITPGPFAPTWRGIQDNVFTPFCTACHIGAGAPLGMELDEANSYAILVGIVSDEQPSLDRVTPFDPDNSYLIQKLEGTAGDRMPLGGPYLDQAAIDIIRQWITDGALP